MVKKCMPKLNCVCVCMFTTVHVHVCICACDYVCVCAYTQMLAVVIIGLLSRTSIAVFETCSYTESEDHGLAVQCILARVTDICMYAQLLSRCLGSKRKSLGLMNTKDTLATVVINRTKGF